MKILILAHLLLWNFQPDVRDVVEVQTELNGAWVEIPGPYQLTEDGLDYRVEVGNAGTKFFRIRRWWGEPWIEVAPWVEGPFKQIKLEVGEYLPQSGG
jgi:hypothetical protein